MDLAPAKRAKEVQMLYGVKENMADFSTLYYWDKSNAEKIISYNPDAKIIITVRRPSSRVGSHFQYMKRNGSYSGMSLRDYLDSGDPEHIVARSDYDDMIARYRDTFGQQRVLLLPLEQLKDDAQLYIDRLLRFCDVDEVTLDPDDTKPVRAESSARNLLFARVAKHTAILLRHLRLLRLLAFMKDSPFLHRLLFRETQVNEKGSRDKDYGQMTAAIAELDTRYESLLRSCYDD